MKYIYMTAMSQFRFKSGYLLLTLGIMLSMHIRAQVTVGDEISPSNFSVLEISTENTPGGLRLPHLTTAQRDALSQTPAFITEKNRAEGLSPAGAALGLVIYNTDTNCIEYWDGYRWVSKCFNASEPQTIPTGAGTFTGKTLFDIVSGNDNVNGCTYLATRTGKKTIFSNTTPQDPATAVITAPYSGVQVYTFTPTGTVSKVRFEYVDVTGKVIESLTPDQPYSNMNNISTACKVRVTYKASLDTELAGRNRRTALAAKLYVIYNDNAVGTGVDKKLELSINLMDCTNCGAKTVTGGWLSFMCQNLGADSAIDPFTYVVGNTDGSGGTLGWIYQWGRPTDGHQLRNSNTTDLLATTNTPSNGLFITPFNNSNPGDWRSGSGQISRWGNGTADLNPPKAANDPCPPGWKVPSQKQWASLFAAGITIAAPTSATANTWTWINNGFKVGDDLFLPATGNRFYNTGALVNQGTMLAYWSSTTNGSSSVIVWASSTSVNINSNSLRSAGTAVRCVEDY